MGQFPVTPCARVHIAAAQPLAHRKAVASTSKSTPTTAGAKKVRHQHPRRTRHGQHHRRISAAPPPHGQHHRRIPAARSAPPSAPPPHPRRTVRTPAAPPPHGPYPRRTPAARSAPPPHPRRTVSTTATSPPHPRRTVRIPAAPPPHCQHPGRAQSAPNPRRQGWGVRGMGGGGQAKSVPGKEHAVPGSASRACDDDTTKEDEDEEVYVHTRPAPTKGR